MSTSLLIPEGRTVHRVAGQLGHGADQTLRTYGHLIAEQRTGRLADEAPIPEEPAPAWPAREG